MQFLIDDFRQVAEFKANGYKHKERSAALEYKEVVDLRGYIKDGEMIGIDTESQGLDWTDQNFLMLSVSVSPREGVAYNVNFFEEGSEDDHDFTIEWRRRTKEEGKKYFEQQTVYVKYCEDFDQKVDGLAWVLENTKIKKYMQNGNHDLNVFRAFFNRLDNCNPVKIESYVMDTQAAAHVLDENLFKMASLEELQRFFSNKEDNYNREFELKYDKGDMLAIPKDIRDEYACADADTTRRVAMTIREKFREAPRLAVYYAHVVHRSLTETLYNLERNGAWIDTEALPVLKEQVSDELEKEEKAALKLIPKDIREHKLHQTKGIRLSRNDLIRDTLFDEDGFHLESTRLTKAKVPSIEKGVRKELLDGKLGKKARRFIEHYDSWSEYHTLHSRYLRGFEKWLRPDGRIHSSMSLTTAVTGRVASSKPNMMNNPKRSKSAILIRQLIAAPKGWMLLAADEGQSELRWAAHVANSRSMIRVFKNGDDIHTNTAMSMTNWDKLDEAGQKQARQRAKAVNFGMLFLMSAPGLVKYAKNEYGVEMTDSESQEYINKWFLTYPELRRYHQATINFGKNHGYVASPLGRRRRLPEMKSDDKWQRMEAERMAVNHPIQSPSSDMVLIACNELIRKDMLNPEEILPVLFVHDELVFQVKETADIEKYAKAIQYEMENPPLQRDLGVTLKVPLVAEVSVGPNLASMQELTLQ
jgi:DNA polymerase-1